MSLPALSIGVDPGPIPGIVAIFHGPPLEARVFQSDPNSVVWLVRSLLDDAENDRLTVHLQVEKFVVGPRSAKSATAYAGQQTREMIGAVMAVSRRTNVHTVTRSASEVMPWASDRRLSAVKLYTGTKGMPHARAAARHALFIAVRDGGLPDPLSADSRKAVTS
jgi:hypothetical protein